MSAASSLNPFGSPLTEEDYKRLNERWITREIADLAGITRVDSYTAREMFGRRRGDLSGIIIPNISPWDQRIREYRGRLDHPELEYRIDGSVKEANKYIQAQRPT